MNVEGRDLPFTRRVAPFAVLVIFMALVPTWVTSGYWLDLVALGLIFGLLALSVDLLWGYAGILNLGPVVSFGLGAYTWAIVTQRIEAEWGMYLALAGAVAVPALLAGVVAYIAFRGGAKEIYFALITLALTLILDQVARGWLSFTGGSNGILGIPWPTFGGVAFDTPVAFYYFVLAVVACVLLACMWLVRSRIGLIFQATRQNETRAETLGYSTLRFRVLASIIAGGIAGLGGALYAPLIGIVEPTVFAVALTVQAYVWVAIGGQGTLIWPVATALVITVGQSEVTGGSAVLYNLGIGAVFIAVVILMPGGLASVVRRVARVVRERVNTRGVVQALKPGRPS